MKLYGFDLPELKPENAKEIIECCRDLHQDEINRHKKNTQKRQWDKYWVAAYNVVLEKLNF
jgi:hypothetical protein